MAVRRFLWVGVDSGVNAGFPRCLRTTLSSIVVHLTLVDLRRRKTEGFSDRPNVLFSIPADRAELA
jgi:hypothetical protein